MIKPNSQIYCCHGRVALSQAYNYYQFLDLLAPRGTTAPRGNRNNMVTSGGLSQVSTGPSNTCTGHGLDLYTSEIQKLLVRRGSILPLCYPHLERKSLVGVNGSKGRLQQRVGPLLPSLSRSNPAPSSIIIKKTPSVYCVEGQKASRGGRRECCKGINGSKGPPQQGHVRRRVRD